jgi:hypothetical protein
MVILFLSGHAKIIALECSHSTKKEAGRLVRQHKADPKTSTFNRKDEAHG